MKKIFAFVFLFILLSAPIVYAAGSCTQTYDYRGKTSNTYLVTLICTGDSSDGSIPNTVISGGNEYIGMYLYSVTAFPTSGGTAPDAADVFILDSDGEDLLGSVDGGTTALKGANLIHATLTKTTLPYSTYLSMHYFPSVTSSLTLKVANQATNSANYTIKIKFVR